jgi:T-complex protein 1 subunit delta
MDKMIQTENTTIITNDGATILKHMAVLHPAARMVISCHRDPGVMVVG